MRLPGQKIVVVVSGCAQHGKDTLSDLLAELLPDARRDAYAAPLKMCVHLKTGIPMEILHGTSDQKESISLGRYGKTPRRLMQEEGQEARERLGKTVWMDRAVERALAAQERVTIISDGRHPQEEIEGVQERAGRQTVVLGVRVVRPSVPVVREHVSETKIADVSDDIFDVVVSNEGTLEDLRAQAQQVADLVVLRAKTGLRLPTGFVVTFGEGRRLPEPMVLREEAEALARGWNDEHEVARAEVAAVSFDRVLLPQGVKRVSADPARAVEWLVDAYHYPQETT